MAKYIYCAVQEKKNGKSFAYVDKIPMKYNALGEFRRFIQNKDITNVGMMTTKRDAEETTKEWNKASKENGTYMYS